MVTDNDNCVSLEIHICHTGENRYPCLVVIAGLTHNLPNNNKNGFRSFGDAQDKLSTEWHSNR